MAETTPTPSEVDLTCAQDVLSWLQTDRASAVHRLAMHLAERDARHPTTSEAQARAERAALDHPTNPKGVSDV